MRKFLITVDYVLNPLFLSLKGFNLIGDLVCLIISCLFLLLFQSSLIKNRNFIQFRQKVISQIATHSVLLPVLLLCSPSLDYHLPCTSSLLLLSASAPSSVEF